MVRIHSRLKGEGRILKKRVRRFERQKFTSAIRPSRAAVEGRRTILREACIADAVRTPAIRASRGAFFHAEELLDLAFDQ